jgi:hypothetical protein
MAITWLMEWRILSRFSLSLVLGRTTGAVGAGVVAATLLTVSCSGPVILWVCVEQAMNQEADALLESLLDSLLNDFNHWFKRGQELLAACPDSVMTPDERDVMRVRLDEGLKAIAATRALVNATPAAMAVSMEAMTPWHQLVIEVWGLAGRISKANAKNSI